MKKSPLLIPPILVMLAVVVAASGAAAAPTVRASANVPIYAGPGSNYYRLGTLDSGRHVPIDECTRGARWCYIRNEGGPDGWVLGSYLVGSAAKINVMPYIYWTKTDYYNIPGRQSLSAPARRR